MRWMIGFVMMLAGCQAGPEPSHRSMVLAAPPPPFCTRTLGMAECFADPLGLPDHPSDLGDTPIRPVQPPEPWWKKIEDYWN
jgi:hypothetical protein